MTERSEEPTRETLQTELEQAEIFTAAGRHDTADHHWTRIASILDKDNSIAAGTVLRCAIGLAYHLARQDKLGSAATWFATGLKIAQMHPSLMTDESRSDYLESFAKNCSLQSEHQQAADLYCEALMVFEQLFGSAGARTRWARRALIAEYESINDAFNAGRHRAIEWRIDGVAKDTSRVPVDIAVRRLQKHGLVAALSPSLLNDIIKTVCKTPVFFGDVATSSALETYYNDKNEGAARAKTDGWLSFRSDAKMDQRAIVSAFADAIGPEPLLHFVRKAPLKTENSQVYVLFVQGHTGNPVRRQIESLDDIADIFNRRLRKHKDDRRFYPVQSDRGSMCYWLLKPLLKGQLEYLIAFRQLSGSVPPLKI
jgi:hypothetical protein